MKLFAAFAFVLVCLAAWSIHGVPGNSPAPPKATPAAAKGAPGPLRMNPEMYADAVLRNAPLRIKLKKQYPESYAALEQQTKRDLSGCLVSQVIEGVLKAVCQ